MGFVQTNTREPLNGDIIVGVDARPTKSSGYCIWVGRDVGKFYTMRKDGLPWEYENLSKRGNSSEFEMKNALYALLKWTALIEKSGKLWFYTDNTAINGKRKGKSYGSIVRGYLSHLKTCCSVEIMNETRHHIDKWSPNEAFKKYIQPADYLSRMKKSEFRKQMQNYYRQIVFKRDDGVLKVREQVDRWAQISCTKCGFCIPYWFFGED